MVLIEIKRDKRDIEGRKESFEFQAIRYAASYATIKSTDELIQKVFSPYVEKHKHEFQTDIGLTSAELAQRLLSDFIEKNGITAFNEHQRIILVASEFDEQTLSAVAWLNSNQVDISCFQICPYRLGDRILLDMKKVLLSRNHIQHSGIQRIWSAEKMYRCIGIFSAEHPTAKHRTFPRRGPLRLPDDTIRGEIRGGGTYGNLCGCGYPWGVRHVYGTA